MSEDTPDHEFLRQHPHAMHVDVKKLYRYQAILTAQAKEVPKLKEKAIRRLEQFLVDQWLYHGLPSQMNDPFEAKPHYRWPETAQGASDQKRHLEKLLKEGGVPFKKRRDEVSRIMAMPDIVEEKFGETLRKSFADNRLCCFTELGNDLLFWAHYADSHRGVCFEFDATRAPIGLAFKVRYDEAYPTATIPVRSLHDPLRPLLTKSPDWEREKEYRSLLVKDVSKKYQNLDESGTLLHIPTDVLTGVYFGAEAPGKDKDLILSMLAKGPFNPQVYHGELSPDSYKVVFKPD